MKRNKDDFLQLIGSMAREGAPVSAMELDRMNALVHRKLKRSHIKQKWIACIAAAACLAVTLIAAGLFYPIKMPCEAAQAPRTGAAAKVSQITPAPSQAEVVIALKKERLLCLAIMRAC